jgi:hypothetical protein
MSKRKTTKRKRRKPHPARGLRAKPQYATKLGAAYVGDSLELMKLLPAHSVSAIIMSPPYALHFK